MSPHGCVEVGRRIEGRKKRQKPMEVGGLWVEGLGFKDW